MASAKEADFEAKKEKLLAKRRENGENRKKLNKLLVSFGALTVLSSGMTAEAQENKPHQPSKKDKNKSTMIQSASSDSIFDKKLSEMTADFDAMMNSMNEDFSKQTKDMDEAFEQETQKPERTSQSMIMKGGLIVGIKDQNGQDVKFKKDFENDHTTKNILDQLIRGKMNADNRYSQIGVIEDVAKMVYDLNNNPAEFDKAVHHHLKGVRTRTEKDGAISFLYTNKNGQNYKIANFSKEDSENNPAIKRIQTNEAMNQKNMEKSR